MSRWTDGPICGFDLETTHVDPTEARIVTASGVAVTTRGIHHTREWLANPGIEIPPEATAVHGVTTEYAREHGAEACCVASHAAEWLHDQWHENLPIVIYNAPYDLAVTDCELTRHDLVPRGLVSYGPVGPVIDPLVIDKHVDRYRKGSRKLRDTCAVYGITLTESDAHTSTGDALAAIELTKTIATRYPVISAMSLNNLQSAQAEWYREQQLSFARYLRQQALKAAPSERPALSVRADDVVAHADDWPLRSRVEVSGS